MRVTVEALTVPDHVKFHVRHRRQGAPESVVEESQLTLRGEGTVTDRRREQRPGDSSARVLLDIRSGARHPASTSEYMSWFLPGLG